MLFSPTMIRHFVTLCFLISGLVSAQDTKKPNVIVIMTDDQSWDSIGFMGGKVHTPRLDQMAKEGLYFSDFNVTSTVCSPSRYSFLTGRFAGRCRGERFLLEHPPGSQTQVENIGELEPGELNLPKLLQRGGYHTGFVGKSHIIRHDWLENSSAKGHTNPLETYPREADPRDPEINAKMQRNHQLWCDEMKGYGFDFVDGFYSANLKELQNDALNVHNLDWNVSKALDFLDQSQGGESGQPFFLYFSTTLHHGPAPWVNKSSLEADPRMTGEGFVEQGFDALPSRKNVLLRNREAGFPDRAAYALWLDDGVGAILDKVAALGLEEDTLILFVPDHGSYRHGKATLYDYGMRVPFLAQWKGTIEPGSTYDGLVANIDITPTILDLAGIVPPDDYQMDGISFRPVIEGSVSPLRDVLFGELGHSRCIKTKDWKYIAVRYPPKVQAKIEGGQTFRGFQGEVLELPHLTRNSHLGHHAAKVNPHYFEADQLYDLRNDPEELENVYSRNPELAREMKSELSQALKQFENRPFGAFTTMPEDDPVAPSDL